MSSINSNSNSNLIVDQINNKIDALLLHLNKAEFDSFGLSQCGVETFGDTHDKSWSQLWTEREAMRSDDYDSDDEKIATDLLDSINGAHAAIVQARQRLEVVYVKKVLLLHWDRLSADASCQPKIAPDAAGFASLDALVRAVSYRLARQYYEMVDSYNGFLYHLVAFQVANAHILVRIVFAQMEDDPYHIRVCARPVGESLVFGDTLLTHDIKNATKWPIRLHGFPEDEPSMVTTSWSKIRSLVGEALCASVSDRALLFALLVVAHAAFRDAAVGRLRYAKDDVIAKALAFVYADPDDKVDIGPWSLVELAPSPPVEPLAESSEDEQVVQARKRARN
jgi:hypothetical protein